MILRGVLILMLAVALTACGRKGPLEPPPGAPADTPPGAGRTDDGDPGNDSPGLRSDDLVTVVR